MRLECDFSASLPVSANLIRRLRFEDANHKERLGWRELFVVAGSGVSVFNSNVYGNGITDELKAYPEDMLTAPLNERVAELSFTKGAVPAGAKML
jgi:hypothetical protein